MEPCPADPIAQARPKRAESAAQSTVIRRDPPPSPSSSAAEPTVDPSPGPPSIAQSLANLGV
jgi:hypothetical protein